MEQKAVDNLSPPHKGVLVEYETISSSTSPDAISFESGAEYAILSTIRIWDSVKNKFMEYRATWALRYPNSQAADIASSAGGNLYPRNVIRFDGRIKAPGGWLTKIFVDRKLSLGFPKDMIRNFIEGSAGY